MIRVHQLALGDQFSTVIDFGAHGRISGVFDPTKPEESSIEAFQNSTTLPDKVARALIAWPVEGSWEEAGPFLDGLVSALHVPATVAAVARLFGVAAPEAE